MRTPAASTAGIAGAELMPAESSPLSFPGVCFTPVGLELPTSLPYSVWAQIVGEIYPRLEQYRWAIGDALNFGYHRYGETYSQAEDETKMDYFRLADYKWVAAKVPLSVRNENLSWSHHRQVTKFPPETQKALLLLAQTNRWGVAQFKDHIATMERKDDDPFKDDKRTPPAQTDPEQDAFTAEEEAEKQERTPRLSREEFDDLIAYAQSAPAPTPAMLEAVARYRSFVGDAPLRCCPHCGGVL